jgi:hypothetical protein
MKLNIFSESVFVVLVMLCVGAQGQPDGPTGTVQQQLVGGLLVDPQTQADFGLLTLTTPNGTCSASMLNDSWAITAAHCVFPSLTAVSTVLQPSQITLSSAWPGAARSVTATKIVPLSGYPFNTDIALVQTNAGVLALPDRRDRVIRNERPVGNTTVTAFGRGINALAFRTNAGVDVPVVADGKYRSAQFDITAFDGSQPNFFGFNGKNGAAIAGGDSGGPTLYQDWDNPLSPQRKLEWQLMGVHHDCQPTCLAGHSCTPPANPWTWVSAVSSCRDANVFQARDAILNIIMEPGPLPGPSGNFPTNVPPELLKHPRALYALNINEPLIAPANAAVDIQLTFRDCHSVSVLSLTGCFLAPSFQIWGYDPATHSMLHLPSGKCLNISGAHKEPGAWIILYPCSGAPNEKWSLVTQPASAVWTIKSDFSGLCLTAIPGAVGGGRGPTATVGTPGKLTQGVCNGSTAQKFDDADAGYAQRNGPH